MISNITLNCDTDLNKIFNPNFNVSVSADISQKQLEQFYRTFEFEYNSDKNEEEKEMKADKIVDLYFDRKITELRKERDQFIGIEIDSNPVVDEYNKLIQEFKEKMNTLYILNNNVLTKTGYKCEFGYEINEDFVEEISNKYHLEYNVKEKELLKQKEEILAILQISDSEEYIIKTLKTYGILDKNGRMVTE